MRYEVCENCQYYANSNSYPDTGFCKLNEDYVKADDGCIDFEEVD